MASDNGQIDGLQAWDEYRLGSGCLIALLMLAGACCHSCWIKARQTRANKQTISNHIKPNQTISNHIKPYQTTKNYMITSWGPGASEGLEDQPESIVWLPGVVMRWALHDAMPDCANDTALHSVRVELVGLLSSCWTCRYLSSQVCTNTSKD